MGRETDAQNNKDVDELLTIFHPDMVWPWPNTPNPMIQLHGFLGWVNLIIKDGDGLI